MLLVVLSLLTMTQKFNLQFQGQSAPLPRTAFVHLLEWTWDDIAQECENFLGPQGFAAVQISPPNEHAVFPQAGFPWWQRYQPVSYQLVSRSGDRRQLQQMIARCHAVGVDVYADAVINHMALATKGIGSGGTYFISYHYPGLYSPKDFHTCRDEITTYDDHDMVTNCELVGLPDLDTGSDYVRHRIVEYLKELVQLGVKGFRIDAAKHIKASDLNAIVLLLDQSVKSKPYLYQEVIDPGNEAVKKNEYYRNGDVIEFEYGRLVGEKFLGVKGQSPAQLQTLGESWGLAPSDKAVVFIDNHDKQRGHGGGGTYLTYKDGQLYDLANIFMLAFPYGYPQVMSSYAFSNSDQGPPADAEGHTRRVYTEERVNCFAEWRCEHRRQAIAAMVGFRNYTAPVFKLTDWWSNGQDQIAFGRGDRGFVVINRATQPLTHTFQTHLPPGAYCNVVRSYRSSDGHRCSRAGEILQVDAQGQFTATIESMSAIAIHGGAKLRSTSN